MGRKGKKKQSVEGSAPGPSSGAHGDAAPQQQQERRGGGREREGGHEQNPQQRLDQQQAQDPPPRQQESTQQQRFEPRQVQQQRYESPQGQQQRFEPRQGQQQRFRSPQGQPQRFRSPQGQPQRFEPPQGQPQRFGPPQGQPQRFGPPQGQPQRFGPSQGQPQRFGPPQGQPQRFGPPQGQQQKPAWQQQPQQPQEQRQSQQPQEQRQPQQPQEQRQPQQPQKKSEESEAPIKELAKLSIKEKPTTSKESSPSKAKEKYKVPDNIAKALVSQIPLRKKNGTIGRPIKVFVNMVEFKFGRNFRSNVVHYDVKFDPEKPRYLIRHAFQKLQQQHFPKRFPAFDGRKNAFSAGLLPFGESFEQTVEVPNEDGRIKSFKITMEKVNDIDISWLVHVKQGLPESERDTISVTALDTILRQAAYHNLAITPVGRSFFSQPRGQVVELGDGLELWVGLFQSAVLGWKPLLNIDVAHKGFPKSQGVLEAITELCKTNGVPSRQDFDYNRDVVEKYLKRLKVTYQIPGQPESKRTYTINGFVKCARDNFFEHQGSRVSVEHYYLIEKKYKVRFPDLPCLHVGPLQKTVYVPAELCTLLPGQVTNTKLNENQTATLIKYAATGTDQRKKKIMDAFNAIRHNQNPCIQEFGLSIGGEFEKINARVLEPPRLTYAEDGQDVRVMKGVWRASRFNAAKSLPDNSWTILCLDSRTQDSVLRNLEDMLTKGAYSLGMNIGKALTPYGRLPPPTRNLQDISKFLNDAKKKNLLLVFVVVPDRPPNVYSKVKQVAELTVGVLTQCLKAFTVFRKLNPATIGNILLKVNAKLNGVNHTLQRNTRPRCLNRPCMIVGADVTHPSPDAKGIPSIAAVAASHDPKAFKYHIEIRLQPQRTEIIEQLEEIMIIQLKTFREKTQQIPQQIIFYRDGVSEGQFPQVMHYELQAIRRACSKMNSDYKPPISFFVVQKRHHIRLFPTDERFSDDRNKNVQAGTIVDTEITHPSHIDFYLVSHASIQGTARPTKYRCLWDDSNMDEDEIQQLTYFLCHMFSRCTRSVSYPTPTYYAHLAAFRARALTQDVQIDVNNLQMEQRLKLTIKDEFLNNPMFFV